MTGVLTVFTDRKDSSVEDASYLLVVLHERKGKTGLKVSMKNLVRAYFASGKVLQYHSRKKIT